MFNSVESFKLTSQLIWICSDTHGSLSVFRSARSLARQVTFEDSHHSPNDHLPISDGRLFRLRSELAPTVKFFQLSSSGSPGGHPWESWWSPAGEDESRDRRWITHGSPSGDWREITWWSSGLVMYSLCSASIYQVVRNKTSSTALLTRFISNTEKLETAQDIKISDK